MANVVQEQVFFISAENLRQGLIDGSWKFCRPSFYIRQNVDAESVKDKQVALLSYEQGSNEGIMKVRDPFIVNVYTDESGQEIHEIISGNTRARALLEKMAVSNPSVTIGTGKDAYVINVTEFADIPFCVIKNATYEDAISIQTDTNDFTKPHEPLDIAIMVFQQKPVIEADLMAKGFKLRKAQAESTAILARLFKRELGTILQGYSVMSKGTNELNEAIRAKNLSLDTASILVSKGKEPETINKALSELLMRAETEAKALGQVALITKKQVLDYFADKPVTDNENNPPVSGGTANSASSSSSSSNGDGSSDSGSTDKKPVTREEFIDKSKTVFQKISGIEPAQLTYSNAKEIASLNQAMLDYLLSTIDFFPVAEQRTMDLFNILRQFYLNSANPDLIADHLENAAKANRKSEDEPINVNYASLLRVIAKADKPAGILEKISSDEVKSEEFQAESTDTESSPENVQESEELQESNQDETQLSDEPLITAEDDRMIVDVF